MIDNFKKSLYYLAPLFIGVLLLIGAGIKIINGLNDKGYANIQYFEVYSPQESLSAISHDFKISFPNGMATYIQRA